MKQSLTITSLVVLVLGLVAKGAGVPIVDGNLKQFVTTGAQLLGIAGVYWGRFRQGDVDLFGRKVK